MNGTVVFQQTAGLAVIGGGPAGLMAAEAASEQGAVVDLFERMGSVGRKFLIAGKGGLNLTHSEPFSRFTSRYGERALEVARWLRLFDPEALRDWARRVGVETIVGSSGRVFPSDLKAAPLLRRWVRKLRERGVRFHVQHRFRGWDEAQRLRFETPDGPVAIDAAVAVLALGGGSWSVLGSDGCWVEALAAVGVDIAPLRPANCGFEVPFSKYFSDRFAGTPIKPAVLSFVSADGSKLRQRGEFVITQHGVEGSLIYALSAPLRDRLAVDGQVEILLDLAPSTSIEDLTRRIARPQGSRSLSEHLRRSGCSPVVIGLLFEVLGRPLPTDPACLAAAIKSLRLRLTATRPIDEAISTAGGVRFENLDESLMLRQRPGVFCAGEMLDWEAPTGGYLLTACFASGRIAGEAAARYLVRERLSSESRS